jgi:uncharacterized membrane protein YqjE
MTDGDGARPRESAEKSLGEIVAEVSEKASLLVREEIELAKAEVSTKVSKLGKGAVVGAVGATFLVFALIYLFHALAYFIQDAFDTEVWVGYLAVTGLLLVLGVAAVAIAIRLFRSGAPPTPQLAIEEARKTREQLEEART